MSKYSSAIEAILSEGIQGYHSAIARACDSIAAAIFIDHIAFWQSKSDDGWAFRTQEEIEDRTAMRRTIQENTRRHLKELGVLEEERKGVPARLYYRVNFDNLEAVLQSAANLQTSLQGTRKQECGKPANYLSKEVYKEVSNSPEGDASASAADFVALLDEGLTDAIPTLTKARKARYGREFKEHLGKGIDPQVLDEAVDRIVERWEEYQLTVEKAIRDNASPTTKPNGNGKPKSSLPQHEQWKEGYYRNLTDFTGGM